ncbi:MAG: hypothetical protein LBP56_06085 [Odoribacteraceae bacterium]|jgi:hypothetical protein|nr:hypothetical protein [Odoribacteraceae bacterium]
MKKCSFIQGLFLVIFSIVSCVVIDACRRDELHEKRTNPNLFLRMSAYDTPGYAEIIPDTRLFLFYKGTGNDMRFRRELLNITRTSSHLSTRVEAGDWYLALVAPPRPSSLLLPRAGLDMAKTPLYKYDPTIDTLTGKSSNAEEIFIANAPVTIHENQETALATRLNRNIAMVEIIVRKATANFNKAAVDHTIELHHVPSTVSYTGALLPDKHAPDTLPATNYLRARVKLENHPTESGYLCADTVRFLIPAHRGSDFLAANPIDTITLKMLVRVNFQRTGGSRFIKSKEIPAVAKCNHILRVGINVNDGLLFSTETLPWEEVNISGTVGENYSNWLYVKQGSTGSGQSWRDPLPDITTAIATANTLRARAIPVHGILVAGGTTTGVYQEAFSIPAGTRIFGGWKGTPGTELSSTDRFAPYTSAHRDLAASKAIITPVDRGILLEADSTVFDGFIVRGVTGNIVPLTLNKTSAWINAVELRDNTSTAAHALALAAGIATNILVADNSKGISLASAATLVNATVVNNAAASTFAGKFINSVYWGNAGDVPTGGTIQYSAFTAPQSLPGLNNFAINAMNTAWFTSSDTIPGPHFNLAASPKYAPDALTPNRSPMLGRGNRASFDAVTTAMKEKKDIDGNPRHNDGTDIGCYEGIGGATGFRLRWNLNALYISTKANNESEHPVLLVENAEGAHVKWWVRAKSIEWSRYSLALGYTAGEGSTDDLGIFKLKSGNSPNTGNTQVSCGKVILSSNLGSYLPDVELEVFQTPGTSRPWTSGYAGSFHRNNEVEERLISGSNNGAWKVRVVSGIDWIKIDTNPRGYNNGIVEETPWGEVSGTGNIKFRVGLKSTLPPGHAPRYGLITITRDGGAALFFVRQGEEPDYIYGPASPGRTEAPPGRPDAVKFSPYNLTDPQGRFDANGVPLGKSGGGFVDYPSKTGYFFKFSDTRAYYPDNSVPGTKLTTDRTLEWSDDNDPCPPGYHTPTNSQFVESYFLNKRVNTAFSGDANTTFVWGRIADGYFDRFAADGSREHGTGPDRATEGLLIYNDYNNASVFFPMAGKRITESPGDKFFTRTGTSGGGRYVQWTLTRTKQDNDRVFTTHSYGVDNTGHLGMSCWLNETAKNEAASVRCVKD